MPIIAKPPVPKMDRGGLFWRKISSCGLLLLPTNNFPALRLGDFASNLISAIVPPAAHHTLFSLFHALSAASQLFWNSISAMMAFHTADYPSCAHTLSTYINQMQPRCTRTTALHFSKACYTPYCISTRTTALLVKATGISAIPAAVMSNCASGFSSPSSRRV